MEKYDVLEPVRAADQCSEFSPLFHSFMRFWGKDVIFVVVWMICGVKAHRLPLVLSACDTCQLLSLIIIICYAASQHGGYSAVAICELVFAAFFFVIFMMELDKQIQVVNWVWSVSPSFAAHTHTHALVRDLTVFRSSVCCRIFSALVLAPSSTSSLRSSA